MASDNGQTCSDCKGSGTKIRPVMAVDSNGKTFTDVSVEICGSCSGSGVLPGRSQ